MALFFPLVCLIAACSRGPWHINQGGQRIPKVEQLRVDVAAGCAQTLTGYVGVVTTYHGSLLVPANPVRGLICRYYPAGGVRSPDSGHLARQTRLDPAEAETLAGAIRGLDLRVPSGSWSCPADSGTHVVIGLTYLSDPDVGLWYRASGCQTIDNGNLGAFQSDNPSFSTFQELLNQLSPPVWRDASAERNWSTAPASSQAHDQRVDFRGSDGEEYPIVGIIAVLRTTRLASWRVPHCDLSAWTT